MEKEYICETKIGTWQDRLKRSVENLRVELKFFDCKILRIALFLSSYFLLPYSDIQYCNITLRGYVQFSFFFRERHKLAMLQNRPLREIPFGINGSWGNWIKLPIMCANNLFYSQILLILPPPLPPPSIPISIFHIVISSHTLSSPETELQAYEMHKFTAIENKMKGYIVWRKKFILNVQLFIIYKVLPWR